MRGCRGTPRTLQRRQQRARALRLGAQRLQARRNARQAVCVRRALRLHLRGPRSARRLTQAHVSSGASRLIRTAKRPARRQLKQLERPRPDQPGPLEPGVQVGDWFSPYDTLRGGQHLAQHVTASQPRMLIKFHTMPDMAAHLAQRGLQVAPQQARARAQLRQPPLGQRGRLRLPVDQHFQARHARAGRQPRRRLALPAQQPGPPVTFRPPRPGSQGQHPRSVSSAASAGVEHSALGQRDTQK